MALCIHTAVLAIVAAVLTTTGRAEGLISGVNLDLDDEVGNSSQPTLPIQTPGNKCTNISVGGMTYPWAEVDPSALVSKDFVNTTSRVRYEVKLCDSVTAFHPDGNTSVLGNSMDEWKFAGLLEPGEDNVPEPYFGFLQMLEDSNGEENNSTCVLSKARVEVFCHNWFHPEDCNQCIEECKGTMDKCFCICSVTESSWSTMPTFSLGGLVGLEGALSEMPCEVNVKALAHCPGLSDKPLAAPKRQGLQIVFQDVEEADKFRMVVSDGTTSENWLSDDTHRPIMQIRQNAGTAKFNVEVENPSTQKYVSLVTMAENEQVLETFLVGQLGPRGIIGSGKQDFSVVFSCKCQGASEVTVAFTFMGHAKYQPVAFSFIKYCDGPPCGTASSSMSGFSIFCLLVFIAGSLVCVAGCFYRYQYKGLRGTAMIPGYELIKRAPSHMSSAVTAAKDKASEVRQGGSLMNTKSKSVNFTYSPEGTQPVNVVQTSPQPE